MSAKGSRKRLAACVLVGAGVLFLVFGTRLFVPSPLYTQSVTEFLRHSAQFAGRRVRVEGYLVTRSVVRQKAPCAARFDLAGTRGDILHVHYAKCGLPAIWQCSDGIALEVTVEGKLGQASVFEAEQLMMLTYQLTQECTSSAAPSGWAPPP